MSKFWAGGFVAAVLLLIHGHATDTANAQQKDKDVKKPTAAGVIEIGEGKDGKFRFFVRDGEGKLLAMSSPGGFASAKEAQDAITDLKDVLGKAKVTMLKKDAKDK
jgi:hypothetical protein